MQDTDNNRYGELVDVGPSYVSIGIQDSVLAYTPAATQYLAPSGEFKYDPKQDVSYGNYDGVPMFAYVNEGPGEVTVSISGVPEKRAAELTGKPYDETKGTLLDTGSASNAPWCALAAQIPFGDEDGNYKLVQFLKGKFTLGAISAKSRGEKTDPQGRDLVFHPVRTAYQWTMPDGTAKGLKAITADTTDPAFTVTPANWFAQVQTPLTIGSPSALALSSSNPADDASGVLATAHPTLTFSNKIDEDNILLIKQSDNSIVSITKSYDSTGKILTITPATNLTSVAIYQIVVAGVKDIYGQSLAPSVINFTVA